MYTSALDDVVITSQTVSNLRICKCHKGKSTKRSRQEYVSDFAKLRKIASQIGICYIFCTTTNIYLLTQLRLRSLLQLHSTNLKQITAQQYCYCCYYHFYFVELANFLQLLVIFYICLLITSSKQKLQ